MKEYEKLLIQNKAWARQQADADPGYFQRLVDVQTPKYLWIGCSDSRVPPDKITQTQPGEIFIHRNIANLVVHTDLNLLSVLQYAVEVLKVEHIIVCGHYGCGGVKAAMSNKDLGIINKWLRNIKDVYRYHQDEIDVLPNEDDRLNRLIELNISEQIMNLAKTSIVQRAWKDRKAPYLHGWVYSLNNGIILPICEIKPGDRLDHSIYEYDLNED
ncbi:MAG: carbonate dehydratase [Saprospiraceae bacterium]|nr:carbonate dehydratase [Saprospiraceae bacterium]HMX89424.1 carbonate dehydratase [Saprospiraceae bacterium]HMZ40041.1 carbonate dehydratase [Saprospiraceae bacterium]HNA65742.1 carbonate dehydratase [Saprospiraceae bacterium]HNB31105.1 carbonate dehydratase [Saprospiraceae bacterium]